MNSLIPVYTLKFLKEYEDKVYKKKFNKSWRNKNKKNEIDLFRRNIQSILNKISNKNFDKMLSEIINIEINTVNKLFIFIEMIYYKIVDEISYIDIYINIIKKLNENYLNIINKLKIVENNNYLVIDEQVDSNCIIKTIILKKYKSLSELKKEIKRVFLLNNLISEICIIKTIKIFDPINKISKIRYLNNLKLLVKITELNYINKSEIEKYINNSLTNIKDDEILIEVLNSLIININDINILKIIKKNNLVSFKNIIKNNNVSSSRYIFMLNDIIEKINIKNDNIKNIDFDKKNNDYSINNVTQDDIQEMDNTVLFFSNSYKYIKTLNNILRYRNNSNLSIFFLTKIINLYLDCYNEKRKEKLIKLIIYSCNILKKQCVVNTINIILKDIDNLRIDIPNIDNMITSLLFQIINKKILTLSYYLENMKKNKIIDNNLVIKIISFNFLRNK